MVLLALSVFRIPVRHYAVKVIGSSFVISLISILQRDFFDLGGYAVVTQLIAFLTVLWLIFNLPLHYSLLVGMTGYLSFAVYQIALILIVSALGWSTTDMLQTSLLHFTVFMLAETALLFAIVMLLQRKKIGFMFIVKRLTIRQALSWFHFFLAALLIIGMFLLQTALDSFRQNMPLVFVLTGLAAISLFGLIVTFIKNKKDLREKYKRLHTRT